MATLPAVTNLRPSKPWRVGEALRLPRPSCISPPRRSAIRWRGSKSHLGVRLFERSAHGVRHQRRGRAVPVERVGGALSAISVGDRRLAPGREQQLVRALRAQHREPVADAAPARLRAGLSRHLAQPVSRAHAQRFRPRPGRHRHPLRHAELARPGGGTAVRGTHHAAGQPGVHPASTAEASRAIAPP